ncbi:MAG: hypothetical protein K2V38_19460, partial [Gemmataceae bacterium]|nr:hypothetical protein [Gemmataceae bacterium]
EGFDALLATFGTVVTTAAVAKNPEARPQVTQKAEPPKLTVRSLQSDEQTAAGTEGRVVLRSGVWTGAIAALVCLALLAGQQHYLKGRFPAALGVIAGLVGGLVVGLVGGAVAQGLFFLAPGSVVLGHVFRVVAWALLGCMAGAGLSLFVPNMRASLGLAGGAVGGIVGAVGFVAVSSVASELVGRLVGGLALGFGIGLMVAIAEAAFRRAWLEVRFGERETIVVTLGPEPIKVGSDARACTVWARGAPALALRFFVRDGRVVCDDVVQKRETTVGDGFAKEVGNLTVTVRTGSGDKVKPEPPKVEAKKPAPARPRAEDDGFDLPMPMTSAPAASKPVEARTSPPTPPAKPVPPPVPKAVAVTKPAVPPRPPAPTAQPKPVPPAPASAPTSAPTPPAIQSQARNPDACPGCGRVIPGPRGSRFCMVCDQTF